MTTAPRSTRALSLALVSTLMLSLPVTACAMNTGAAASLVDLRAENRLQVIVRADSARDGVVVGDRVGRDLLAIHFRLEAVDAAGRVIPIPASAQLVLRIGGDSDGQVTFSRDLAEITVPRPYAIPVGADDEIFLALVEDGDLGDATLRLTIDYEAAERTKSRVVARSVRAALHDRSQGTASFEWRQPVNGRVLAISGLPLERVATVVLMDGATGEPLWTTDLRGRTAGPSARSAAAVRLGVPVVAGRSYRLEVTLETATAAINESVVAMVVPEAR